MGTVPNMLGTARQTAAALLVLAFAVHTLEEALGLPAWMAEQAFRVAISARQVEIALGIVMAGAVLILLGLRARPASKALNLLSAALAGALMANTASHLGLSFLTKSYMPGLGSALALMLPASVCFLRHVARPRLWPALMGAALMLPITWAALMIAARIAPL